MFYCPKSAALNKCLLASSLAALSTQAFASAFMLHESAASLLGEFYAGSASVSEDASTNFYNSAGLTKLKGLNFSASGVNISTYGEFVGNLHYTRGGTLSETGHARNGASRLVPALHISTPLGDKWAVGFSASAPWGLATEYSNTSIVRYQSTYSELKTINLSPSLAFAPKPWVSFGAGFDALYARAELDGVSGNGITTSSDSKSISRGNGWAYGYHVGGLVTIKDSTKVGVNFHSQVDNRVKGNSKLVGPLNTTGAESHDLQSTLHFPWYIDGSITQPLGDDFTVLATVEYIHWSVVKSIKLHGVQSVGKTANSVDPVNYKNSWTYLLGLRYQMNDSVMFKLGGGYDQTPTTSPDRTLSIPDSNRWIGSAGVRWFPSPAKNVFVDVGYAHLFQDDADINKTKVGSSQDTNALGHVQGGANLFGAQISLRV